MGLDQLRRIRYAVETTPEQYREPEAKPALWDKVRDCIGLECSLWDTCPFRRRIEHRYEKYINPQSYRCPREYKELRDTIGHKFNVDEHLIDPLSRVPRVVIRNNRRFLIRRGPNEQNNLGPCLVEQQYMKSVCQPLVRLMEEANDPFINQLVGYHLVPRYLDLLHLKLERLANARQVMVTNANNRPTVNPIFREIRAASESILRLWKTTGLEEVARKCGFFHIGGRILPEDNFDFEAEGDPEAYERMASGE
jgi:hypothetical protein